MAQNKGERGDRGWGLPGSSLLAREIKTLTGSDPFYIDERVGINAFMVSYLLRI